MNDCETARFKLKGDAAVVFSATMFHPSTVSALMIAALSKISVPTTIPRQVTPHINIARSPAHQRSSPIAGRY
jgi:hypothetical protein